MGKSPVPELNLNQHNNRTKANPSNTDRERSGTDVKSKEFLHNNLSRKNLQDVLTEKKKNLDPSKNKSKSHKDLLKTDKKKIIKKRVPKDGETNINKNNLNYDGQVAPNNASTDKTTD
jgi:hypothetical protein